MSKTLDALLAVARERISGANPGGRNVGGEKPTTTGESPGIDYASKSSGDRAFVAKHTHIEQEYPNGMASVFKGEPVTYSMDDPKMKNYGKKEAEAVSTYEEVESLDELSKGKVDKYRQAAHKDSKQRDAGRRLATDKLTGKAKVNATEEVEPLDELTRDTIKSYRRKSADQYNDARDSGDKKTQEKRGRGLDHSFDKLAKGGTAKVHAREEVEPIDEISKGLAGRYITQAHQSGAKARSKADAHDKSSWTAKGDDKRHHVRQADKHDRTDDKRNAGIHRAVGKLTGTAKVNAKEEVEHTDVKNNTKPIQTSGPAKKPGSTQKGTPVSNPLENEGGKKVIKFKEDVVDEGILTCKDSLGRKMVYHKAKMKNEAAGTVKFRHHQKQVHIIKGMLEEVELEEKKKEEGKDVIKYDKRGFAMKKRKYGKDNKKDEKGRVTKEETEVVTESTVDPQVARIAAFMNKEKF